MDIRDRERVQKLNVKLTEIYRRAFENGKKFSGNLVFI